MALFTQGKKKAVDNPEAPQIVNLPPARLAGKIGGDRVSEVEKQSDRPVIATPDFAQDALGKGNIYRIVSFSDHGPTYNSWACIRPRPTIATASSPACTTAARKPRATKSSSGDGR